MPLCKGVGPETMMTCYSFANAQIRVAIVVQKHNHKYEKSDLHLYHKAFMRIQVQLEIHTTTCGLVSLFKELQKTCSSSV